MFGQIAERRAYKRLKKQKEASRALQKDYNSKNPIREKEMYDLRSAEADKITNKLKENRNTARDEGKNRALDFFKTDVPGLDPKQRSAMQFEASRNIDRNMESSNRKLLGDQSQRGIRGRGGVGYAQQRDLQRLGNEAQGSVRRDLDTLDAKTKNQNRAALFGIQEGDANLAGLDYQQAIDKQELDEYRRLQALNEKKASSQYNKV